VPYKVYPEGNKFAVYKHDAEGQKVGKRLGLHASRPKANRQIAALHANEGKEAMSPMTEKVAEVKEAEKKDWETGAELVSYIPGNAVSFEAVEEYLVSEEVTERVKELTRQFQRLAENIMWASDVTDKPAQLRLLVDELDTRLTEAVQKKAGTGFLNDAKSKLQKALGITPKMKSVEREKSRFMLWKEGGRYRWLAVYSNKYRDEDNPPEILSAQAHKEFVSAVDGGQAPFPELWHYHVPGTRWGVSDFVAFDEATGFSLASGTIDKGHEPEAEAVMAFTDPLAVSHGLEVLDRDTKDASIIEKYRTVEISELPLSAAANKLTGFSILKGVTHMGLSADKKAHLQKVGLAPEAIAELEADLDAKALAAEQAGLQSKEATPAAKAEVETPAAKTEDAAPVASPFATKVEVAEAIASSIAPLVQTLTTLTGVVEKMATTDEERIAKAAADTPALSIAALVMKNLSATGRDATRIGVADMALAKDKPEEAKAPATVGIPFIDKMLAGDAKPQ
jgi:hypothetical protein